MNLIEETMQATLDSNSQLHLTNATQLLPGPVRVTIRVTTAIGQRRGLANVIREIATEPPHSRNSRCLHLSKIEPDFCVLYYLDTVIVIYAVEGNPADQLKIFICSLSIDDNKTESVSWVFWSKLMQPTTARDFLKVAFQRLSAAERIMDILRLTLEAQYIGGYSVECSLKALILEKTAEPDRQSSLDRLTQGAASHRSEVLLDRLRSQGVSLTAELAKRMRRYDWTTDLRYETGRKDTGETNGLLRTAKEIYEWVEEQIP